VYINQI